VGAALLIGAVALATWLCATPSAHACGGFFCNQPDGPFAAPPVAQTAENVLFAMDRATSGKYRLTAQVQIFYTGPADRFSWVVPVDSKPELAVGTNATFDLLLRSTAPSFELEWKEEGTCRLDPDRRPQVAFSSPSPGSGSSGPSGGSSGSPRIEVSFRGDVGPYDAAVLRSTNPKDPRALKDWLKDNGYYLSPEGSRLIDGYVREEKFFIAIKLQSGKDVREIAPLEMTFEGPGPCVPLRLTAVAALKDLRINLWVLGQHRVVPSNYFEIQVNPVRIDWFNKGGNYDALVKTAADEAGGNAFVVDFVGPATLPGAGLFQRGRYDIYRLAQTSTPPQAMAEIVRQNFARDTSLLSLLRKHIPEPEALKQMGISEQSFYNLLGDLWRQYPALFAPFDARALAADIGERIVKPLERAQALFDDHAKLTRLSTFISPEEMTVDPEFVENASLPDLPAVRKATASLMCGQLQYTRCNAPVRLDLPDGQQVHFHAVPSQGECRSYQGGTASYQRGKLDETPALAVGWQRSELGDGRVKYDNGRKIAAAIKAHNRVFSQPPLPDPMAAPASDEIAGACACAALGGRGRWGSGSGVFALALALAATLGRGYRRGRRQR
jgi:hypothetical protein